MYHNRSNIHRSVIWWLINRIILMSDKQDAIVQTVSVYQSEGVIPKTLNTSIRSNARLQSELKK